MRASEFLDLELLLRDIDFSSAQQQLQALDLVFGAGCMLVTRFLVCPSADLRGRHPVFTQLQLCALETLTYFSQCQAFDATTQAMHAEAGRYAWPAPSLRLLFKGKFAEIDWINAPSGALSLKRHIAGIAYEPVVEPEMYTMAASLDEVSAFGARTFTALGYSSSLSSGLSFAAFVDKKQFVAFAATLGHVERKACLAMANTEFRKALAYAGERFLTQAAPTSRP
eukprot:6086783-Pleurochrysis_carterae.AAC.1